MSPADAIWKQSGLETTVDPDTTSLKLVARCREYRTYPRGDGCTCASLSGAGSVIISRCGAKCSVRQSVENHHRSGAVGMGIGLVAISCQPPGKKNASVAPVLRSTRIRILA